MSAPAVQVEVEGMAEVLRKIRATLEILRDDLRVVLAKVAEDGQARARDVVPVRTGALMRAITVAGSKAGLTYRVYVKGAPRSYSRYVEYGTTRLTAYGYMRAARERMRGELPAGTRLIARKLPGAVARS